MKAVMRLGPVVLLVAAGSALAQPSVASRAGAPARIDANVQAQRLAAAAPASHRVAVLKIRFDIVDGDVRSATVVSTRRFASIAPKVFARQSGPWEVIIEGDRRRTFYVDSPARREAEADPATGDPYRWVDVTAKVDWSLVVPLQVGGRDLGARAIRIRDTRSGETIVQAPL